MGFRRFCGNGWVWFERHAEAMRLRLRAAMSVSKSTSAWTIALNELVDNGGPGSDTGFIRFRRLHRVAKAGLSVPPDNTLNESPLKVSWLTCYLKRDPFGGDWYVPPEGYWEIFEANRKAPWEEEVAWTAFQVRIPVDECMSTCLLDVILRQPSQYWRRLPAGQHIREALSRGAELAEYAAKYACYDRNPAGRRANRYHPFHRNWWSGFAPALANVAAADRREVSKYLREAEHKCSR
jgi:hypothetical protein